MSRIWYTLCVTCIPDWALREIKTACVNFIWNNGSHLVKHIVKPYLIFSVYEIVPIPIGSISDFCLFIFAHIFQKL
jgi:hypothetical protein